MLVQAMTIIYFISKYQPAIVTDYCSVGMPQYSTAYFSECKCAKSAFPSGIYFSSKIVWAAVDTCIMVVRGTDWGYVGCSIYEWVVYSFDLVTI